MNKLYLKIYNLLFFIRGVSQVAKRKYLISKKKICKFVDHRAVFVCEDALQKTCRGYRHTR